MMQQTDLKFQKQTGYSLIELILASTLTGVALLGLTHLVTDGMFLHRSAQLANSVTEARAGLLELMTNDQAIQNTINDTANTSLECLRTHTACTATEFQEIRLRDGGPSGGEVVRLVHDPTDSATSTTQGFDSNAVACTGYNPLIGNSSCPYRARLFWKPICNSPCTDLQAVFRAVIERKVPEESNAQNTEKLAFQVVRNIRSTFTPMMAQLTVGTGASCVVFADGRAKCWGHDRNEGALGRGVSLNASPEPEYVVADASLAPLTGIRQIQIGHDFMCALMSDSTVKCWGGNDWGQLGSGSVPASLPSMARSDYLPANSSFSNVPVTVVDQVGIPLTGITALYSGQQHMCAGNGTDLYCWGNIYEFWWPNPATPAFSDSGASTGTALPRLIGYDSGTNLMTEFRRQGHATTYAFPLPPGRSWTGFSTGHRAGCFILSPGGFLNCFGSDSRVGVLSSMPIDQILPYRSDLLIAAPNIDRGVSHLAGFDANDLQGVVDVQVTYDSGCALLQDTRLVCWGRNYYRNLGRGEPTPSDPLGCKNDDYVRACEPRYVLDPTGTTELTGIVQLGRGHYHSCALNDSGEVFCWGKNWYGEIADGTSGSGIFPDPGNIAPLPKKIPLPAAARTVGSGKYYSCAMLVTDEVYCWGINQDAQLGLGPGTRNNPAISTSPGRVMGL